MTVAKEISGYRVRITGTVGQRYAIERAVNSLSGWLEIGNADNAAGIAEFLDTSGDSGQKFYRSRLLLP